MVLARVLGLVVELTKRTNSSRRQHNGFGKLWLSIGHALASDGRAFADLGYLMPFRVVDVLLLLAGSGLALAP